VNKEKKKKKKNQKEARNCNDACYILMERRSSIERIKNNTILVYIDLQNEKHHKDNKNKQTSACECDDDDNETRLPKNL